MCYSGYDPLNKVFMSNDAGDTWINYSDGLPNLPINCIIYERGSNDGLYVGTDAGVYYRNNFMSTWECFNDGMPHVSVRDMDINYTTNKILAGTYGRGLWESTLACPANYDLTISNYINADEFQEAQHDLTSTETFSDGLSVKYRAGSDVHLDNGFHLTASTNSNFHAYIHGCDAPGNTSTFRLKGGGNNKPPAEKNTDKIPKDKLSICYPNPFTGSTTIEYNLTEPVPVTIIVYNTLGEKIKDLVNNMTLSEGSYKTVFNGGGLDAGIYYYTIIIGNKSETGKMVLIKN